jgi:hypothetical protein
MLVGCATPMSTGSTCVVEPGYLDQESTFTWRHFAPIDLVDTTGYVSPLMQNALRDAVVSELGGKGFEFVERQDFDQWTDVEVALTLRVRREVASLTINESPCRDNDCWERIDVGSATRMDVQTIGFLAADVYYMGEPIWRGWVERPLFPADRDGSSDVISQAVPALFESFPP